MSETILPWDDSAYLEMKPIPAYSGYDVIDIPAADPSIEARMQEWWTKVANAPKPDLIFASGPIVRMVHRAIQELRFGYHVRKWNRKGRMRLNFR